MICGNRDLSLVRDTPPNRALLFRWMTHFDLVSSSTLPARPPPPPRRTHTSSFFTGMTHTHSHQDDGGFISRGGYPILIDAGGFNVGVRTHRERARMPVRVPPVLSVALSLLVVRGVPLRLDAFFLSFLMPGAIESAMTINSIFLLPRAHNTGFPTRTCWQGFPDERTLSTRTHHTHF